MQGVFWTWSAVAQSMAEVFAPFQSIWGMTYGSRLALLCHKIHPFLWLLWWRWQYLDSTLDLKSTLRDYLFLITPALTLICSTICWFTFSKFQPLRMNNLQLWAFTIFPISFKNRSLGPVSESVFPLGSSHFSWTRHQPWHLVWLICVQKPMVPLLFISQTQCVPLKLWIILLVG
jgi:hypothetical protein